MAIPAGGTVQAGDYCCCWKQRVLETAAVLPASPAISDRPNGTAGGTGGTGAAGAAQRLHGRGATAAGGPEVRSRRASLRAGGPAAPAQLGVRRRHVQQPLHHAAGLRRGAGRFGTCTVAGDARGQDTVRSSLGASDRQSHGRRLGSDPSTTFPFLTWSRVDRSAVSSLEPWTTSIDPRSTGITLI